jgi:hypothetical protein
MFKPSKRTLIAALVAAAAAAPSAASARFAYIAPDSGSPPSWQSVSAAAHQVQPGSTSAAPRQVQPGSSTTGAFDWGDAAIGAGAAVALMGGATIGLSGGRRRREHPASAN